MSNKNIVSWQAPEFKAYEKNVGWYTTLIAIAVLVIGFFVIVEKDYFAAITLGILSLLIIYFSRQKPQLIEIQLTNTEVRQGNIHVPYKQIQHFWVVNKGPHKSLNFETSSYLNRLMVLELQDQDPEAVREFLLPFVPEHEQTEASLSQKFMHWFKF